MIPKVISIVLCLSILILPIKSYGNIPQKCTKSIAVTTPCEGVLLPESAASQGLNCLKIDLPKLKLQLELEKQLCESREKRLKLLLKEEIQRGDRLFKLHKESTAILSKPWYEHPVLWFAVGFIVATGTTVGITYAVNNPN